MAVLLRRGGAQDVRFLRDMLHHAYYWRERVPGSLVSRYVEGWGRPGDTAVIALEDGFPVGAAWFRLFQRAEPGYGFVDESTPELAIAVVPSKRGHGIGDELLGALSRTPGGAATPRSASASSRATPRASCTSGTASPVATRATEAWTMVAELASTSTTTLRS